MTRKGMKEIKLKIGELSRLCHVSVRTIYHYEEIGLLQPSIINDNSGHRYYGANEMKKLFLITQFKDLGFTLFEIQEMFDKGSLVLDITCLEQKIYACEQELKKLQKRCKCLKEFLAIQQLKQSSEDIYFDSLPSIVVASNVSVFTDYDKFGKYLTEVVIPEVVRQNCKLPEPRYRFSRELAVKFGSKECLIEYCERVEEKGKDNDLVQFKQLPEVPLAICKKVYGSYDKLYEYGIDFLSEVSKRNYHITDLPRYNYIDGIWNQKDPKKWLTIIQVPVEKVNENSVN